MAAPRNPLESFIWGEGGAALTPEEIASRRKIEAALTGKIDTSPVGHWTQGLARVADAFAGAVRRGQLNSAEKETRAAGSADYDAAVKALTGGASASAPSAVPMTGAASEVSATAPTSGGNYRDAIASIESAGSGDYSAVGPTHPKMGRALGRYQIMESNIGPWSQAALGRQVTPDEFMADPKLQDAIFDHQFNQYVQKYGPEGAAQAWLGGPGGVGKVDRKDSLGTSIGSYGKRFMTALGPQGQQVASLDPSAGMPPAAAAIETAAPQSGYIDPMGSVQPNAAVPALGAPQTVSPAPTVASVPAQEVAQNGQYPTPPAPPSPPAPPQAPSQSPIMNEALLRAISSPYMTEGQRSVVQMLIQQQMSQQQAERERLLKQNDPAYRLGLEKSQLEIENMRNPRATPSDQLAREKFNWEKQNAGQTADIKEYQYAVDRGYQGSFVDFQLAQKKAGASSTNVTVGEGDKFYEKLDQKNAETFASLSDTGMQARSKMAQIDRLEGLMANAPQGAVGALKQAAGEWGIATEGLSDIQAASALLEKMVPEQRAPGSGPMSDADIKMFRASLPRVINQPGGNQLIFQTMRGIAQYEMDMGAIADRVANRELKEDGKVYSPADARRDIAKLQNPLSNFKMPSEPTPNQGRKTSTGVEWSIGD